MKKFLVATAAFFALSTAACAAENQSSIRVGKLEEAQWSQTTVNAAKTPEEQAILSHAEPVTLTGEILDASCYLQMGKKGQAHIACGAGCIRNGMPIALLTAENEFYLIFPEEHDPRRGGTVSIREFFADRVGQVATVTGLLVEHGGHHALFVAGAPLTPTAAAAAPVSSNP